MANATAGADVVDVREGFRIRGMGLGAQDNGSVVVESYAYPNVQVTDPFSVSDPGGNNDGYPEPGENVLLSVSVTNPSSLAINSVLANVNGGPNISYGSIASGATVTMQIPYSVPAGAGCGTGQTVTINLSSSVGTQLPATRTFILGVPGATGAPQTASYTGPGVAIPDNDAAGVNVILPVSGVTGAISDMNFRLDGLGGCSTATGDTNASVDHTFLGDLAFKLTSPGGTTVSLIENRGGSGDNYCTVLLDDDSGFPAAAAIPATGAVTGNFSPESPLSAFDGQSPVGDWTLNVSDTAGFDTGSLRRFSLIFTVRSSSCPGQPTGTPTSTSTPTPTATPSNTPTATPTGTPCTGPTTTFSNTGAIAINDNSNGSPYPSDITVNSVGTIGSAANSVSVTLNNFSHTSSDDVGIVLVSPSGAALLLQDGAGDDPDMLNITYSLSDAGSAQLPNLTAWPAGTYKPTGHYYMDSFPAPGPQEAYNHPGPAGGGTATFATTFGGTNPNGTWHLYFEDFADGDSGSISGGWSISFAASCAAPTGTPTATATNTPTTTPTNAAIPDASEPRRNQNCRL